MKIETIYPVRLDDDVIAEVATLYQEGELTGQDIDNELLDQLISLNN